MSKTSADLAHISSRILTWAIARSGKTRAEIATTIGVQQASLAEWEREKRQANPTFTQAENLADALGIPFGYFYLQDPPPDETIVPDARRIKGSARTTPFLRQLLDDILIRQDWYRLILAEAGEKPLKFVGSMTPSDGPDKVAKAIRDTFDLTPDLRRRANDYPRYLGLIAEVAERHRILVMRSSVVGNNTHKPIDRSDVQGLALADPLAPIVFVNSSDYRSAQVFTLAHELAHVWIGQSAINNPDEGLAKRNAVEEFCNKVAADVLVPRDDLIVEWKARTDPLAALPMVARRFWVSRIVVARRALDLHLITLAEFNAVRKTFRRTNPKRDEDSQADYYRLVRSRSGHLFTDTVLAHVNSGRLMIREAAAMLAMNASTLALFAEGAIYP